MATRKAARPRARATAASRPASSDGVRMPQSTVAAPFRKAISPMQKSASATFQRRSDRDIDRRAYRLWRLDTGIARTLTRSAIQAIRSAVPIQKAIQGPGPETRSTDPAQAAIGSAQIRLVARANPVRPHRSASSPIARRLPLSKGGQDPVETAPAGVLPLGRANRLCVLAPGGNREPVEGCPDITVSSQSVGERCRQVDLARSGVELQPHLDPI